MIPSELESAAKEKLIVPFIGAGFSRVLGLPNWGELVNKISTEIGFDPEIAALYGDYLQLAEYYIQQKGSIGPLRSDLEHVFNNPAIDVSSSRAHMLLPELKCQAIYTTNWDNLIERAFDAKGLPVNKIVTVDHLKKADPHRTSVVKFHGDFTDDNSIVFTESSYFGRMDFESPLDIRLRSDMLSHTLLFIGYSLSDFNVRYMWFKLQKLLAAQKTVSRRLPYAYIVLASANPIFEAICVSRDIGVLTLDGKDTQAALIDTLEELASCVP